MSTPFVGEIRLFGFPRIPNGWFACDGSLKSIAEYEVLFTLIGTTYGGDGQTSFAVPDLRGRIPIHQGRGPGLSSYVLGQMSGSESVTLIQTQLPQHNHALLATTAAASTITPGPTVGPGNITGDIFYITDLTGATPVALAPNAVQLTGNNQAHDNTMPTLTMSFCIAWAGVFPSQN